MPNSFAPIFSAEARVLILGSMPGVASLTAGEYYAHPRNAFWQIMNALCGAAREVAYVERLEKLQASGIALWDVLESCQREGSLDSAIVPSSIVVNQIPALLEQLPHIRLIVTNGGTASQLFKRHVIGRWQASTSLQWQPLPSTSPAHASLKLAEKIIIWQTALAPFVLPAPPPRVPR